MARDLFPPALQMAYRDLLERHLRRPEPELRGSVMRVRNHGGSYWVARERRGARVVERRIGPDHPDVARRAHDLRGQNERLAAWRKGTGALVAQLRAGGLPTPAAGSGKLILALERAGAFERGAVLAGTHAFALYEAELGVRMSSRLVQTEDVDVALDRTVRVLAPDDGARSILSEIGLRPIAGPGEAHPVRWESADGIPLDLLIARGRGGGAIDRHPTLGVWAQALPYLEFSLEGAIPAVALYREGALVRVPAPERFAVHKLIVAGVRTGTHRAKSGKDLDQAEDLLEALSEARPFEVAAAWEDAMGRGPRWRAALRRALAARPRLHELLEAAA